MPSAIALDDPRRASPLLDHWRALRHLLETAFALFGDPSAIAAQLYLAAKDHRMLARWLTACERLLRKLLLIEAAALPPAPAPARRCKPHPRLRRTIEHLPEHPEDWHVYFRVVPPASSRQTSRSTNVKPAESRRSASTAWPLAERFEALIRAFNDPAPILRRLARLLRAKPARARDIAAEPWPKGDIAAAEHEDLLPRAEAAVRAFNTS